jgi:hypothetical protein
VQLTSEYRNPKSGPFDEPDYFLKYSNDPDFNDQFKAIKLSENWTICPVLKP